MAGVESAWLDLRRYDFELADTFRSEAARMLSHAKRPFVNLTPELLKAAKDLRCNEDIFVTSADKGGRTVILRADQYAEMCEVHLNDNAYESV